MRLTSANRSGRQARAAGFALMEVLVGMAVIGFVCLSLYAALASGVSVTKMSRENLRATQILLEKSETFRIFSWDQILDNSWNKNFSDYYSPTAATNARGTLYSGTIAIAKPGLAANYNDDMRQITLTLNWTTGNLPRSRTMTLYIARNGMQNYIY